MNAHALWQAYGVLIELGHTEAAAVLKREAEALGVHRSMAGVGGNPQAECNVNPASGDDVLTTPAADNAAAFLQAEWNRTNHD